MNSNEVYTRFKRLSSLEIGKDNYVQNLYEISKGIRELTQHLKEVYKEAKPEYLEAFLRGIYILESKLIEGLQRYKLEVKVDDIIQGFDTQRNIIYKMKNEEPDRDFNIKVDGSIEYAEKLEKRLANVMNRNKKYAIASLAVTLPLLAFFTTNKDLTARAISPSMSSTSITFSLVLIFLALLVLLKDKIHSMLKKVLQFSKRV